MDIGKGGSASKLVFALVFIGSLVAVILAIFLILVFAALIALRVSDKPQFCVKSIDVPEFKLLASQTTPNLTANMDVFFESSNENKFAGIELWNVAMQTVWFEAGIDVNGTNQIQHYKQGGKSVHDLPKMNVELKDVQIFRANLKKEDIKLDITLRGRFNFYHSFLWSRTHCFKVLCEKVAIGSHYVHCKTEYLYSGLRYGRAGFVGH